MTDEARTRDGRAVHVADYRPWPSSPTPSSEIWSPLLLSSSPSSPAANATERFVGGGWMVDLRMPLLFAAYQPLPLSAGVGTSGNPGGR